MGEAIEFEELLAALTDESRIQPQMDVDVQPRVISNQHQVQSNASLNALTDDITFNLSNQPNSALTSGGHLHNQIMPHRGTGGNICSI